MAPTAPKHFKRPGLIFIPWCVGTSRPERLVRKHVPDSDPGCALRSTSMPALHGRNVPNCRPMADGGTRRCSAGACPPLESEWGVAESTVPTRHTKSQLRLFIPWCAGASRPERYESMSRTSRGRGCLSPAGVGMGRGRIHRANSPYQIDNSCRIFIPSMCRRQPA